MRTLNRLSLDRIDALGACVSGLCLVHCTAMPLLLAFSPTLAHLIPGDEWLHGVFACLVVGAGLPSFFMGFRRHRKLRVPALGLAGMCVILGALAFGDRFNSHAVEIGVTSMGSVLLTAAHLTNRTFCRRCRYCEH